MATLARGEIRVRDAGPFLQLTNLPRGEDDDTIDKIRRRLPRREVLERLTHVCNLVLLLEGTLLPSLHRLPTDAAQLVIMDACAKSIKKQARKVGGSFEASCLEFAQCINSYTAVARGGHPENTADARGGHPANTADACGHLGNTADEVSLRDSIDDLLGKATRLLNMTYTPYP